MLRLNNDFRLWCHCRLHWRSPGWNLWQLRLLELDKVLLWVSINSWRGTARHLFELEDGTGSLAKHFAGEWLEIEFRHRILVKRGHVAISVLENSSTRLHLYQRIWDRVYSSIYHGYRHVLRNFLRLRSLCLKLRELGLGVTINWFHYFIFV